jgi:pyruvate/2-oxoglutarate dehydrogenase complex dihydrolipoamide acyltransferase (E2) component
MASTEFHLPALPSGGPEAAIVRWFKRPGDAVAPGEPLLIIVNDRLEVALPAPSAGVLDRILVAEGAPALAGALIATIAPAGESTIDREAVPAQPGGAAVERPPRASPLARRIARDLGVDITLVAGSGIAGRILKTDVLAALGERDFGVAPTRVMARAPAPGTPHPIIETYTLTAIDVELNQVAAVLARQQAGFERRGLELTYTVCIALAAVEALQGHPLLNSFWAGAYIQARRRIHLSLVPNGSARRLIHDAQDLNLRGMARAIGHARHVDTGSAVEHSFSIVELGQQVWADPAPQAGGRSAALGVGSVRPRPCVSADGLAERVVARPTTILTLAYDARVLDQCYADGFLRDVKQRLERFDTH